MAEALVKMNRGTGEGDHCLIHSNIFINDSKAQV